MYFSTSVSFFVLSKELPVRFTGYICLSIGRITLRDLKRCRMAHIFYDTFFNLEKYLDHEQRDPFAVQKVTVYIEIELSELEDQSICCILNGLCI